MDEDGVCDLFPIYYNEFLRKKKIDLGIMSHITPESRDRSLEAWNSGVLESQLARAHTCNLRFLDSALNPTTLPSQNNLYV